MCFFRAKLGARWIPVWFSGLVCWIPSLQMTIFNVIIFSWVYYQKLMALFDEQNFCIRQSCVVCEAACILCFESKSYPSKNWRNFASSAGCTYKFNLLILFSAIYYFQISYRKFFKVQKQTQSPIECLSRSCYLY